MRRNGCRKPGKTRHWLGVQPLSMVVFGSLFLGLVMLLQPVVRGQSQGGGPVTPAAARGEQSPLDQPLEWIQEAKRNYAAVKDYSCTLVSRERVRNELQEENVMQLKMKAQPYSIYMKWLAPKKSAGQEVAFVLGKNNNKMRVKSTFLKNVLGFMSIDPNDPRVLEHSRHNILEAGIGNMIEQMQKHWTVDRAFNKTQVKSTDYAYNQRDCIRIELTRGERNPNFYCYRTVIYLEKQSKLPIRLENYDFPRQGGPAEGELLEMFSYVNLQFNTGLRDEDFAK